MRLVVGFAWLALLVGAWTEAEAKGRVRKSWAAYSSDEKELYLSAIEKAMVSGNHFLFTQLYMDKSSLQQVVGTCGAPAWYRKYLLGYENMLRSLDTTFRDVTLPYWDIFEDSAKRISTSTSCNGIEGCSIILKDLGSCQGNAIVSGTYIVNGEIVPSGNCVNTSIAAYACASLDNCEKCLPRGDWDIGDSTLEFGPTTFADLIRHAKSSDSNQTSAIDTLRKGIQNSVQLTLHSLLGGVYETRAAAFDPIFPSHYATLDMLYQFYQSCNQSVALTGSCSGNGELKVSPTTTIPMKLDDTPVEKHADLGVFFEDVGTTFKSMDSFAVEYELSSFLQNVLEIFSLQCNTDTSAIDAITYDSRKRTSEEAVAIDTLVNDLAACDHTSELVGTTTEIPSSFISCELLSSLMNGAFTNFSTPVRNFFGATQDDLPKCVGALAAVTTLEVAVKPSASCQKAILKDTSINTETDFNSVSNGFAIVTRGADDGEVRHRQNPSTSGMSSVHSAVEARDVPVVSYKALITKEDLSAVIDEAFGYEGIGILVVSGVPELNLMRNELLPMAFAFANLPDDVKAKYELPEAFYSFGWSHGKENLQGKPDVAKGSYYNNPETNNLSNGEQEDLVNKFPSFYHPNIWPKELPELEKAFMKLGQLIVDIGVLVAYQCDKLVETKCSGYEKSKLHRIISTGKCSKARLLHYFSLSEEQIATQRQATTLEDSFAWCGWHNDHGALTGLVQAMYTDTTGAMVPNPDPTAGLYVKNRRGEILKANIPPGHLIYQIGETSQILSGGILQATPHAVRGPQVTGVNRETLAVFMQPLPDEKMAVPSLEKLHEAGKTTNLPKGVPPLHSRWNNDMNYYEFTQATFKAYY